MASETNPERAPPLASSSRGIEEEQIELTKTNGRVADNVNGDAHNLASSDDLELEQEDDRESGQLLPSEGEKPEPPKSNYRSAVTWMAINTLATIGIVFANKAIFSDPSLKLCQLTFACFHFFITFLTLRILSLPRLGFFTPRRASIRTLIPLSIAMCLNVILPNFSLAFSSVTFYQISRVLLTPVVALMNFVMYRATLPRNAILVLIPTCLGVGMVTYFDSRPTQNAAVTTTSPLGVVFALTGVMASSLYTIWIASYQRKLEMSSMQLLHNQAPISAFMLLYVIPFVDHFPVWTNVPMQRWILILISGACASLINISQFYIVAQTGPVSSTVVGHVKTCTIVSLGWMVSGRTIGDKAILGVFVAIGGIVSYSIIMLRHNKNKQQQK